MTDLLAYECLDSVIIKFYLLLLNLLRIELLNLSNNMTAGKFLDEKGRTLCRIFYKERIFTTLISE